MQRRLVHVDVDAAGCDSPSSLLYAPLVFDCPRSPSAVRAARYMQHAHHQHGGNPGGGVASCEVRGWWLVVYGAYARLAWCRCWGYHGPIGHLHLPTTNRQPEQRAKTKHKPEHGKHKTHSPLTRTTTFPKDKPTPTTAGKETETGAWFDSMIRQTSA